MFEDTKGIEHEFNGGINRERSFRKKLGVPFRLFWLKVPIVALFMEHTISWGFIELKGFVFPVETYVLLDKPFCKVSSVFWFFKDISSLSWV